MNAPLQGHNLVRLAYLDEAGTSYKEPHLAVAGVIVHGDREWPQIEQRVLALIDKYVDEEDRLGFVFHAKDIFHGNKYFDRKKPRWADPKDRWQVLFDLAMIIDDLKLPVVAGSYAKDKFGIGTLPPDTTVSLKHDVMHSMAAFDCLLHTDKWLARYAPSELATVVHEDGTPAKKLMKEAARLLRSEELMALAGLDMPSIREAGLPLTRIIDTVHFAVKADARPLQLADMCAFILARAFRELEVPVEIFAIIFRHMRWILDDKGNSDEADQVANDLAGLGGTERPA